MKTIIINLLTGLKNFYYLFVFVVMALLSTILYFSYFGSLEFEDINVITKKPIKTSSLHIASSKCQEMEARLPTDKELDKLYKDNVIDGSLKYAWNTSKLEIMLGKIHTNDEVQTLAGVTSYLDPNGREKFRAYSFNEFYKPKSSLFIKPYNEGYFICVE